MPFAERVDTGQVIQFLGHMKSRDVVVVGGGAAGFFGAVTCAEALQGRGSVIVLERGRTFCRRSKSPVAGGAT